MSGTSERIPMEKTRRQFTPNRKWPFCANTLSSTCRFRTCAHKLHPTLFYQWQKAFFENGAAAFDSRRPRSQSLSKEEDKIAALEGQAQKQD
jgi:transposase